MGTDNLFHKRKEQRLQRKKPTRKPYEKVLIVCEGEKTEPNYFEEFKDFYEIDTANIRISGKCGSDPVSVVEHGIEIFQESMRTSAPFDKVFCVFDRDNHVGYEEAIRLVERQKPKDIFEAITSTPCFEVWFILHFSYTTASFESAGKKSCGARALQELAKYWPSYNKGLHGSFDHLFDQIDTAKAFSLKLHEDSKNTGSLNPLTRVHELVSYLQNIKNQH